MLGPRISNLRCARMPVRSLRALSHAEAVSPAAKQTRSAQSAKRTHGPQVTRSSLGFAAVTKRPQPGHRGTKQTQSLAPTATRRARLQNKPNLLCCAQTNPFGPQVACPSRRFECGLQNGANAVNALQNKPNPLAPTNATCPALQIKPNLKPGSKRSQPRS